MKVRIKYNNLAENHYSEELKNTSWQAGVRVGGCVGRRGCRQSELECYSLSRLALEVRLLGDFCVQKNTKEIETINPACRMTVAQERWNDYV